MMNYAEAIEYIEGLAVFGSQPGFERINALLDKLQHPEKGLRYIHVAGTNGKGSVCTETANILSESGYKTGLFTSPYVSDFRERIQIDGVMIPKESLIRLTERVKSVMEILVSEGIQPTEFEFITAVAFLFFKEENCDVVVLEVGLGGTLDSTNVIDTPLVSAIVSLSLDHMGVLGNTIEEIAESKAGIIKDNGYTVCSPQKYPAAFDIIRTTAKNKSNKFVAANPELINSMNETIDGNIVEYMGLKMKLPLIGPHQIDNLSTTLCIIDALKEQGYDISDGAIKAGIEKTRIPARVEVLSNRPLTILDGGHNEDGARALAETIKRYISDREITLVLGVMADKEVEKVVHHLAPLAKRIITTKPKNPRAMSAPELCEKVSVYCKDCTSINEPCQAYDFAKSLVSANEALIVCGSLYLAGDVRIHMIESLK